MKFTRRDLIHAGCTIAAATLTPSIIDRAEAGLHFHGTSVSALSQRNVVNLQNFSFGTNEYAFIDHIKNGAGSVGPFGTGFNSSASTWPSLLDANGWPNNAAASGISFGGGFNVPDPSNFNGPYIVDFDGNGVVGFAIHSQVAAPALSPLGTASTECRLR